MISRGYKGVIMVLSRYRLTEQYDLTAAQDIIYKGIRQSDQKYP